MLLSLALTATTFFPRLSTATIEAGLAAGAVIGIVGGSVAVIAGRRSGDRRQAEATRDERRAVRHQDRANWQTPSLATLERPTMSPTRRAGLLTLRGYLFFAIVFVIIKIIEVGVAGPAGSL